MVGCRHFGTFPAMRLSGSARGGRYADARAVHLTPRLDRALHVTKQAREESEAPLQGWLTFERRIPQQRRAQL